jgi:poly(beta-D-mannuronate) lyase
LGVIGRRLAVGALGVGIALAPIAGGAQAAPALHSPFVEHVRTLQLTGKHSSGSCATPPAAVHAINGVRYYSDKKGSVIDSALLDENNASLRPVRGYLDAVAKMSDDAVLGDHIAAVCALTWLAAWASADAMNGPVNHQGEYEREWTVGGLALAYLKLRDTGYLAASAAQRDLTEHWLAKLARALEPYYDGSERANDQNNHAYWCGLSVSAAGIAANDRALFDWGIGKYKAGVDMIRPDGSLPLEMRRGVRALHYHLFAAMPLVLLAEMGAANGVDLYAYDNGALHRLAKLALRGAIDPSFFVKATGLEQDTGKQLRIDEIAWIDPYVARFGPNPDATAILAKYRPIVYARFGGNITELYAKN